MPHKIIAIGEILWDLFPEGAKPGGAPANFAYHAQSLGAEAALISAVGNDPLGNELLEVFHSIGLSTRLVQRCENRETGTVKVAVDAEGVPHFTICENVAWDRIAASPEALEAAKTADALCFGSLASRGEFSRNAVRTLLENAPPFALKVFDLNLRAPFIDKGVIASLLPLADVLKLNDTELPVLADMFDCPETDPRRQGEWFLQHNKLRLLMLTRGPQGALLLRKQEPNGDIEASDYPGFSLDAGTIADTVGAGDAFTAVGVLGFLAGEPLERINAFANEYAAYVCTQPGGTPEIPEKFRGV